MGGSRENLSHSISQFVFWGPTSLNLSIGIFVYIATRGGVDPVLNHLLCTHSNPNSNPKEKR